MAKFTVAALLVSLSLTSVFAAPAKVQYRQDGVGASDTTSDLPSPSVTSSVGVDTDNPSLSTTGTGTMTTSPLESTGTSDDPQSTSSALPPTASGSGGTSWTVTDMFKGDDFFSKWDFWSQKDPTNGNVNYLTKEMAQSEGLAVVKDGVTVFAADSKNQVPVGGNRNSVRLSSQAKYNGGLIIGDFNKLPYGCSVWPAFWSVGPNWPSGGEIDIMEGVHNAVVNQYTMHTGTFDPSGKTDCSIDKSQKMSGNIVGDQCVVGGTFGNSGCGVTDTDPRSYGKGFNDAGGGVFATLWDKDGIKIWHFARNEIPKDIASQNPNPDSWGTPATFVANTSCDTAAHFHDHVLTINISICGDWAGATYANACGAPQASGAPSATGATCAEAVANPDNYKNAVFEVNYIAVYTQS